MFQSLYVLTEMIRLLSILRTHENRDFFTADRAKILEAEAGLLSARFVITKTLYLNIYHDSNQKVTLTRS